MAEVKQFPGAKKEISAIDFKKQIEMVIQMAEAVATARKASYEAHIKAGFTKEQAFELCK